MSNNLKYETYLVANIVLINCLHENLTNVGTTVVANNGGESQLVQLQNPLLRLINGCVNIVGSDRKKWIPRQRRPGVKHHREVAINMLWMKYKPWQTCEYLLRVHILLISP